MTVSRLSPVRCCLTVVRRITMGVSQHSTWTQGQRSSIIMVIVIMGVLLIMSSYSGLLTNPLSHRFFARDRYIYGIIFDAGSTGSRIHVFKLLPGKPHKLVDDLFVQVKPGLSAYEKDPKKAAESLVDMLERAKHYIPATHWSTTPMALKATAGLRALPAKAADDILNEVSKLFMTYPFKTSKDSVQIMEGNDEGIFSWVTVNFLSGNMGDAERMMGVVDLGGGSMQISFIPRHNTTLKSSPSKYITRLNLMGKSFQLYTHSYLGLGLMSGRLQTLGGVLETGKASGPKILTSSCLPSSAKGTWTQNGVEYSLSGKVVTGDRFDACYMQAKKVIASQVHQPAEVKDKTFCLISYYYDRAVESGLIPQPCSERPLVVNYWLDPLRSRQAMYCQGSERGGILKVADFTGAARNACKADTVDESRQFMCVDLSYISALLQEGFGFSSDTLVELKKKIHGTEISWALGAMLSLLDQRDESHPATGG